MKKLKMLAVGIMAVGVFIFGSMNIKIFDQIDLAAHGELFKIFNIKESDTNNLAGHGMGFKSIQSPMTETYYK